MKIRLTCPNCLTDEVRADALAEWDEENQKWDLVTTYETFSCGNCETQDFTPVEEKIK